MYLSRLILNPRSAAVQRDMNYLNDLHKTVMSAFPDNLDKAAERVLFRIERHSPAHLALLVQSQNEPDWSSLAPNYLLDHPDNPATKAVNLQLYSGQRLAFRLVANPTKHLSAGTGNSGKRIGLYKVPEQIEWLQRKADDNGFVVERVFPTQQQSNDDRRRDLKFFSVQFDGILQVTAPATFLTAIQSGIGSGKAFGFGLLSVAAE